MESLTKGDIVLFPFPYTDLSSRKLRPCLIISNEMKEDLILCQITSQYNKDNYSIELKNDETISGTLSIDSYVRCNMIFTANKQMILKKICEIKKETYSKIIMKINSIISF